MLRTLAVAICVPLSATAEGIQQVDYNSVSHLFHSIVTFEEMNAAPLPGASYSSFLNFPGLRIGTIFDGQVPFLSNSGPVDAQGRTLNLPAYPVNIGYDRRNHGSLKIARFTGNNVLASEVGTFPNASEAQQQDHEIMQVGQGLVSLRFADYQTAFAFDLLDLETDDGAVFASVFIYTVEYSNDRMPIVESHNFVLTETGKHAFETTSKANAIVSFQVQNVGQSGIGVDNIEYQRPLLLGLLK